MAEALGLDRSLTAFLRVARSAQRFGSELHRFSQDAGRATQEVQSFANSAKTFSLLVKTADVSLRKHCREHSDSEVLKYIAEHEVLEGIAQQADEVRSDLVSAIDQVKFRYQSRFSVVVFIRWTLRKNTIMAVFPALESIKVSLQLILSIATLETMKPAVGEDNDKRDEEIRFLKRTIESQIRMMKHLVNQNEKIQHQRSTGAAAPAPLEQLHASHEHLNLLADSMVRTGRTPWNPMKREKPKPTSRIILRTQNYGGPPTISVVSLPSFTSSCATSSELSADAAVDNASTSSSTAPIIEVGSSSSSRAMSATITSPDGKATRVTAFLDATATGNAIGQSFARGLNLEIEPYAQKEKVLVDLGHREIARSVGVVKLRFSNKETPHRPPISVDCSVVENSHITLILGGPFIKRRDEVWSDRSGE